MRKLKTDVAVIGAGSAGLNAVAELRKAGCDWLLIEGGEYGTTCARDGCMPSKLLIAAAETAHVARCARQFGIDAGTVQVHGSEVFARLRRLRDDFVAGAVKSTLKLPEERRLKGRAIFRSASSLELDSGDVVEARAFVIAVGSSSRKLPLLDGVGDFLLSSETVFDIDEIPRRLAVIGSGPIGLELGQAFARLGAEVTVISKGASVAGLADPRVAAVAQNALSSELALHLGSDLTAARQDGGQARLQWTASDGKQHDAGFDRILVAAGRPSNLDALELGNTGASLDDNGVPEWSPHTTQCGNLPIFIAGDANDYRPLLHEAVDEGRIAGRNAANYPDVQNCTRRTPLAIVFTSPQIATIGCSPGDITGAYEIGCVDFADQGRARVMAENEGIANLYALRENGKIVGSQICGPRAEHLAHLLAWAVQHEMTVPQLLALPFYHPVVEEGLKTALRRLVRKLELKASIPFEHRGNAPIR